jgi:DnaJ-domain-containing protein 1
MGARGLATFAQFAEQLSVILGDYYRTEDKSITFTYRGAEQARHILADHRLMEKQLRATKSEVAAARSEVHADTMDALAPVSDVATGGFFARRRADKASALQRRQREQWRLQESANLLSLERFIQNVLGLVETSRSNLAGDIERMEGDALEAEPAVNAFAILGIQGRATDHEISAAYRAKARDYHPDKVATLAPEFRQLAELKMKEINLAYESLKAKVK